MMTASTRSAACCTGRHIAFPGVPAHAERPAGHQGTAATPRRHGGARRSHRRSHHRSQNHSPARPPRVHGGLAAPDRARSSVRSWDEGGGAARDRRHPALRGLPGSRGRRRRGDHRREGGRGRERRQARSRPARTTRAEKYTGQLPAIPAFDGIGALPDGTLVGFGNPRLPYGALAEKTVVPKGAYMPIPEGIDPADRDRAGHGHHRHVHQDRRRLRARARRCWCRAPPGSPGGSRSRWPGCSAPDGSSRPAATTTSCARCRPSAPTR